ncbi:MAG: hypothetical protein V4576_00765 [Patescibacteria group bacterium]
MSELELGTSNTLPNQFRSRVILGEPKSPKILEIILKTGVVKSEKGALVILCLFAVLVIGATCTILAKTYSTETPPKLDLEALKNNPVMPK